MYQLLHGNGPEYIGIVAMMPRRKEVGPVVIATKLLEVVFVVREEVSKTISIFTK